MAALITSTSDKHFLHMNVLLRHARGELADSERDLETILTEAAVGKRRLWASSLLFAEMRPSAFVPGRFPTLSEFVRYLRAIAIFVTPDPNTMLRAGRLRDLKWQRPTPLRLPGETPRFLSMVDAIQLSSALWVKETAGVANLEFIAFDDRIGDDAEFERKSVAASSSGLHGRRDRFQTAWPQSGSHARNRCSSTSRGNGRQPDNASHHRDFASAASIAGSRIVFTATIEPLTL